LNSDLGTRPRISYVIIFTPIIDIPVRIDTILCTCAYADEITRPKEKGQLHFGCIYNKHSLPLTSPHWSSSPYLVSLSQPIESLEIHVSLVRYHIPAHHPRSTRASAKAVQKRRHVLQTIRLQTPHGQRLVCKFGQLGGGGQPTQKRDKWSQCQIRICGTEVQRRQCEIRRSQFHETKQSRPPRTPDQLGRPGAWEDGHFGWHVEHIHKGDQLRKGWTMLRRQSRV